VFERRVGHFECKFQRGMGEGVVQSINDSLCQKTRVPGLSRGVVCVILRLAVLIQYRRVTDKQKHGQTDGHTTPANTRASIASRL